MPIYALSMCGIKIMQSKKITPIKTELKEGYAVNLFLSKD